MGNLAPLLPKICVGGSECFCPIKIDVYILYIMSVKPKLKTFFKSDDLFCVSCISTRVPFELV